jgi:hypothetical protein
MNVANSKLAPPTSSPTVTQDGHEWVERAGYLWGTYKTIRSYIGFCSIESVVAYAARHNLRRIKHGKYTLLRKDQVDHVSGADGGAK